MVSRSASQSAFRSEVSGFGFCVSDEARVWPTCLMDISRLLNPLPEPTGAPAGTEALGGEVDLTLTRPSDIPATRGALSNSSPAPQNPPPDALGRAGVPPHRVSPAPRTTLEIDQAVPRDCQEAVRLVMQALERQLPGRDNRICVRAVPCRELDGDQGETTELAAARSVQVTIALDNDIAETPEQRRARYALNFTHEVHLHARVLFSNAPMTPDQEHDQVFTPADNNNAYLNAVRAVLCQPVDDAFKRAYIEHYLNDVETHILKRALDPRTLQAALAWHGRMAENANDVEHSMWQRRVRDLPLHPRPDDVAVVTLVSLDRTRQSGGDLASAAEAVWRAIHAGTLTLHDHQNRLVLYCTDSLSVSFTTSPRGLLELPTAEGGLLDPRSLQWTQAVPRSAGMSQRCESSRPTPLSRGQGTRQTAFDPCYSRKNFIGEVRVPPQGHERHVSLAVAHARWLRRKWPGMPTGEIARISCVDERDLEQDPAFRDLLTDNLDGIRSDFPPEDWETALNYARRLRRERPELTYSQLSALSGIDSRRLRSDPACQPASSPEVAQIRKESRRVPGESNQAFAVRLSHEWPALSLSDLSLVSGVTEWHLLQLPILARLPEDLATIRAAVPRGLGEHWAEYVRRLHRTRPDLSVQAISMLSQIPHDDVQAALAPEAAHDGRETGGSGPAALW